MKKKSNCREFLNYYLLLFVVFGIGAIVATLYWQIDAGSTIKTMARGVILGGMIILTGYLLFLRKRNGKERV